MVLRPQSGSIKLSSIGAHTILLLAASGVLLPYVWMLLTAMRSPADIFSSPFGLPHDLHFLFENLRRAFQSVPMARFLVNGAVVVTCLLVLQLAVAIPCAYALAKFDFQGKTLLFGVVVAALCIPIQVPMLPIFIALAYLGALDSYFALIFPFVVSPFAIFLLRQHFKSFPDEIIQAARLTDSAKLKS